ncbi:hypothetical protein C8R44DRAFT_887058 [Mycena epipterygia]|nr:hypothetical protein C8R44DRAFT_887058 [Mycena epipterygia]
MAHLTDVTGGAAAAAAPPVVAAQAPAGGQSITVTLVLPAGATGAPLPRPPGHIHSSAPWVAGRFYCVVPAAPLIATIDSDQTWYAVTRGRYVGITDLHALDLSAILRISGAAHRGYPTQAAALTAFNSALALGVVEVVHA